MNHNQFDLSQNQFDLSQNKIDLNQSQFDIEQNKFDSTQINSSFPPPDDKGIRPPACTYPRNTPVAGRKNRETKQSGARSEAAFKGSEASNKRNVG